MPAGVKGTGGTPSAAHPPLLISAAVAVLPAVTLQSAAHAAPSPNGEFDYAEAGPEGRAGGQDHLYLLRADRARRRHAVCLRGRGGRQSGPDLPVRAARHVLHRHAKRWWHSDADALCDAHSDPDAYGDPDAYSDPDPLGDADAHGGPNPNGHADADANRVGGAVLLGHVCAGEFVAQLPPGGRPPRGYARRNSTMCQGITSSSGVSRANV